MTKARGWHVLMPVRGTTGSKTRLFPHETDGRTRRELALAFAADAVTAVLASSAVAEVSVITADREAAALFTGLGASVIIETGTGGLNAAIRQGLRHSRTTHPLHWRAALMADLPALESADVTAALHLAREHGAAVVPDASGHGTTMLTLHPDTETEPHFGTGSHAAHQAAGLHTLDVPPDSTLRQDVDTLSDLAAAVALGVGPHTQAALNTLQILAAA